MCSRLSTLICGILVALIKDVRGLYGPHTPSRFLQRGSLTPTPRTVQLMSSESNNAPEQLTESIGITMSTAIEGFDASSVGKFAASNNVQLLPNKEPYVSIEAAPSNARRIFTGVDIMADMESIWDVLTNFERLQDVVPSLVKNEVMFLTAEGGARLAQVGGAKVLPGVTFTAKTVLDVSVFKEGNPMPDRMLTNRVDKMPVLIRGVFPRPDSIHTLPHRDIAIQNVLGEGDFEHYQGVWRMQSLPNCAPNGGNASRLTYAVEIKPKGFLPVKLIEGRIATDLKANLAAIRDYVETIRGSEWDVVRHDDRGGGRDGGECVLGGEVIEGIIRLVEKDSDLPQIELEVARVEVDVDAAVDIIDTEGGNERGDTADHVSHSFEATTINHISTEDAKGLMDMDLTAQQHIKPFSAISTTGSTDRIITSMSSSNSLSITEDDRKRLAFENEDIQRLVASLERDLGSVLQRIREIGALSSTQLNTEAA